MKKTPEMERLEKVLRSHRISGPGFLGQDQRPLPEIIDADAAALVATGHTLREVAARMHDISRAAKEALETTVEIEDNLEAQMIDSRGGIVCPWPHPGYYSKAVVTVTRTDTGQSIRWSELNIHMIEAHGFFEGRGSLFRIEPRELVEIIFPK